VCSSSVHCYCMQQARYLAVHDQLSFDLAAYLEKRLFRSKLTPLEYAIEYQSVDMIKALIKYGADVRHVSSTGFSLLHYAAKENVYVPAVFDALADAGVSWDTVSEEHGSVLHTALAHSTHVDIIRYEVLYCVTLC
jgi:hypothetical protein